MIAVPAHAKAFALRTMILVAIGLTALCACSEPMDRAEWTEEVMLSDGSMVHVAREAWRIRWGNLGTQRGSLRGAALEYPPARARWKMTFSSSDVRLPISFDLIDGAPLLVLEVRNDAYCRTVAPEEPRVQVLRWQDGRWIEVPHAQAPWDRLRLNLVTSPWTSSRKDDLHGLVRWEQKGSPGKKRVNGQPETVRAYMLRVQDTCGNMLK